MDSPLDSNKQRPHNRKIPSKIGFQCFGGRKDHFTGNLSDKTSHLHAGTL